MLLAALLLYPLLSSVAWVWLYVSTRREMTTHARQWRASHRLMAAEAASLERRCSDLHRDACEDCKGRHVETLCGIVRVRQQLEREQRSGPWV